MGFPLNHLIVVCFGVGWGFRGEYYGEKSVPDDVEMKKIRYIGSLVGCVGRISTGVGTMAGFLSES